MPASATVNGTNADFTSSPYTDRSPTPQPGLTRQSAGAASRTCCACAGAAQSPNGQRETQRQDARMADPNG